jgi:hypothetical protein
LAHRDDIAPLQYDSHDFAGVIRAVRDLQSDIEAVTSKKPALLVDAGSPRCPVLIGTLGRSAAIDRLVEAGKLDVSDLKGHRESFVITTVPGGEPGVDQALVIVGSDKRGTIYGIYELSEQIGVSPWHWWADVPPPHQPDIFILPGRFASGEPVVRYRGIFINDEAPCLTAWAAEKFGGLNSKFYGKVFELLLRLRGNYLWPAMWDNAFNEDDPENPRLADEYGIVMGTSHHEPMMREHKEWTTRRTRYGNGQWNYATNAEALQRFFREGVARNQAFENLVTIGMRGDGDEAMTSTGSLQSDLKLLQRIFGDQRAILAEELKVDPATVPQLWALFTEVQKFYDAGLRPPDDVTLLFTDDNTGNLRRLPTPDERVRPGGSGIYYHFDMHGGPYSYQWINTNPLPKVAEQMNLAFEYGATRIWIVNVGDLKPLELPIEFFLRLAWNPAALNKDKISAYMRRWAERDFGPGNAAEIASIAGTYAKFNGWRKPEQITPDTFSQLNYGEAERIEAAWRDLVVRAEKVNSALPAHQRDAFYQLVLHPVKASATVAEMNIAAGRNRLYARQGRASTNAVAERVRELFRRDRALSDYYNHGLSHGKWNHLMDQTHLGQHSWEPPIVDVMPPVVEVLPADDDRFGVAVEGSEDSWPGHFGAAVLPVFDSFQPRRSYVDVFGKGTRPFQVAVTAEQPWVVLTEDKASTVDRRYWVEIDWQNAPVGRSAGTIVVSGDGAKVRIRVPVEKATADQFAAARGRFASLSGPIAFAAASANRRGAVDGTRWENVPDYGRGDGAVTVYPVTAGSRIPPQSAPYLDYDLFLPRGGDYEITLIVGPVMDFVPDRGMRVAMGLDENAPQVVDIFADRKAETYLSANWWNKFTKDNARHVVSSHSVEAAGPHRLRLRMVDPGIVVQKIIVACSRSRESYFGPPDASPVQ